MSFDLSKWLLSCFRDYNKAANGTRFSERWRNDMARRAGISLGRYYATMMKDLYSKEEAHRESFVKTKPLKRGVASAHALSILIREPQYAGKIKIRI